MTIRIVALTGVWELHPTKRFATDCLNRSAARGRKSSVSCFAHQKSAEDRNHLLRRQVSTRGRALCGAQIRNVRPVLVRTFRGYKIANGASLCVTSPLLLHRVRYPPTVPDGGIIGVVMIKISRSNSRQTVRCACSWHVSVLGNQEAVRKDMPSND